MGWGWTPGLFWGGKQGRKGSPLLAGRGSGPSLSSGLLWLVQARSNPELTSIPSVTVLSSAGGLKR